MKQKSTLKDVARMVGMSTATVSRVLSRPDLVRPSTREMVSKIVAQLDYQPDVAARTLASKRSYTVGCVIPTLDHAIFARSTQALQTALTKANYQLIIASHEYDPDIEFGAVKLLQQRGIDGLVLVGTDHSPKLWKQVLEWDKPTILTWSCDPRLSSIGFDNEAVAKTAVAHLLKLGHTQFGVISGTTKHNDRARSRIVGIRKTLTEAGLYLDKDCLTEQVFNLNGGRDGLQELMKAKKPPTAIICGNDLLATGALLEAQRMGIQVPRDLSICGIDDHDLAEAIIPGLTTVRLPTQDLGRMTSNSILSAIAGESIASQTLLPFQLIERGSTAAPSK